MRHGASGRELLLPACTELNHVAFGCCIPSTQDPGALYQDQLNSEGYSRFLVRQHRATLSRQLNELETYNDCACKGLKVLAEPFKGKLRRLILEDLPEQ